MNIVEQIDEVVTYLKASGDTAFELDVKLSGYSTPEEAREDLRSRMKALHKQRRASVSIQQTANGTSRLYYVDKTYYVAITLYGKIHMTIGFLPAPIFKGLTHTS